LHGELKKEQFSPPAILGKFMEQGQYGLKTGKGFYDYGEGAVETMKRQRDKRLYARLRLVRQETESERNPEKT
jgi:3-hydroxyacyl-CoA dehydrogenase